MRTIAFAAFAATVMAASAASAAPLNAPPIGSAELANIDQVRLVCSEYGRCYRTRGPRYVQRYYGGDDRYVLLASDGVWDALSLEDAHALVLQHEAEPLAEIAQRLVQAAVQKGSRDNVSAMLLDVRSFR